MKKYFLMACAAVALVGCNKGGTGDEYGTSTAPATPPARERPAVTDTNAPGAATSPGTQTNQSTTPQP